MKKICIIGSGGAGKSTLSRKLGEMLNIPVHHLDQYFWLPGWVEGNLKEFAELTESLCEQESWILDGSFSSTYEIRFSAADTIIFLDMSRLVCFKNLAKRYIKYRGRTREDIPEGCSETLNYDFLKWVWQYGTRTRPKTIESLKKYDKCSNVVILKSRNEVEIFLRNVRVR
jgi:adenylate kinase family enzyme